MKSMSYDIPIQKATKPIGPGPGSYLLKARHGQFYSSGGIPHGMSSR